MSVSGFCQRASRVLHKAARGSQKNHSGPNRRPRALTRGFEPLEARTLMSISPTGVLPLDELSESHLADFAIVDSLSKVDDHGNTFETATPVSLASDGSASRTGSIERAGDVDFFRFVANLSGPMTIRQSAAAGSQLDSYLYVYNGNRQLLAQDDDGGEGLNSRVTVNVTAGQTYYVKAAAYGSSSGAYTLQLDTTGGQDPDGVVEYFALLVGSGASEHDRGYVENDVAAVEESLTTNARNWHADNIMSITCNQVSEAAIDRLFEALGNEMDGDDMLLFYYTGHGSQSGLTLCSDEVFTPAELADNVRNALPEGAASVSILDACYSGVFVDAFAAYALDSAFVLSACTSTQSVPWDSEDGSTPPGRSMFTSYLTDSFDADGDRNQDGLVTLQEVYAFVDPRTIAGSGHDADPQYYSAGASMDNFPLVI